MPSYTYELVAGLSCYLAMMLGIGFWSSRQVRDLDDFLVGGRRLGPWVTAISERASGESAWFLMGLPGAAYALGFREFWAVIGIAVGILASWLFIAQPLRIASAKLGALTLPDYFAARFPERAVPLRLLSTAAVLTFYVSYLGAQILGAGKLFSSLFGWENVLHGALVGAGVVAVYTLLGGFLAVAWTDLVQGLLMAVVAVLLPVLAINHVGWDTMWSTLHSERGPAFFAMGNFALDEAIRGFGFGAVVGGLAWGLGYLGQPHLLTRYMAIRNPKEVHRATLIAMGWVLLAYWGVTFVGLFGVAVLGPDLPDRELVVAAMASHLLPAWAAGFAIAGILAAIMSSADSQLLVATSSVVEDVAVRLVGWQLSKAGVVRLSRVVTVVITGIALLPVLVRDGSAVIDTIVAYAWAGLGATFGPALILSLWWRNTTGAGVIAGMASGLVLTLVWKNVPFLQALLDLKVASFVGAAVAVVLFSIVGSRFSVVKGTTSQ